MTTNLALVSLLFTFAYALLQTRMHLVATGHSVTRNAFSDYGTGRTAGLFRLAGFATTMAVLALALALVASGRPALSLPVELLGAVVATRIPVILFPADLPGAPRTSAGWIHLASAVAQFAVLYTFLDNCLPGVVDGSQFAEAAHVLVGLAGIALTGVCLGIIPAARRFFGLAERIFLGASTAAVACCALALMGI